MSTVETDVVERKLPSGVVTFVMTDVVDSTALWERSPDCMSTSLLRHDELVLDAVESHGGVLLKHRGEGDSTFSVFAKASAAVAAAMAAQRALAGEAWDSRTPISVRMGVHTGEAIERGHDYYGQTVNRAARVRAVATGGQVLLSETTARLTGADLPDGTELVFLRREVLRGIEQPEPIHELVDRSRPHPVGTQTTDEPDRPHLLPAPLSAATRARFTGRAVQVGQLAHLRALAASGAPQVVLLGGEPGAGKSSLAAQAAAAAHAEGWVVLHGTCDDELAIPYEPFRTALGQYVDEAPIRVLADHVTDHGGEVGRLVPGLSARVGAVAPLEALDQETARQLLASAVTDLVERAAADAPVLLVLDDLHWADRSTLLLVRRLARTLASARCLVLATYRSSEREGGDFGELLPDLRSLPAVTDIQVAGLDEAELVALLEGAAGHALGDEGVAVARYLVTETGGNPYFATEVLRHFVETEVIGTDEAGRWRVQVDLARVPAPATVRGVLSSRLGRLGDEAVRLLSAASVIGREFDLDLLAGMLDLDEAAVLDGLEAAVAASLLREVEAGRFSFAHALVQHTLYDGLGATRRALHHRRLAHVLEARVDRGVTAAEVASHWLAAGRSDDAAKVAAWCRRAGDEARAQLAPEDAVGWYRTALDAVDPEAGTDRVGLMVALGDSQRWAGVDGWRETLLAAAALATELGDDEALVEAALANNRGGTSRSGATDAERVDVLERALAVTGAADSPQRARLLATLCIELSQSPDWEQRVAIADEAVACARRLDDPLTLLRVLMLTTEATRFPHTYEERVVDTEELFSIAKRLGDPVLLAIAAVRQVRVLIEGSRVDEVGDAMAVLGEVGGLHPYSRWNAEVLRAVLAHIAGDLEAAIEHCEEGRRVATADGQPDASSIYVAELAMIRQDQGRLSELEPLLAQTVADYPAITGFRGMLAAAYAEMGRLDEARGLLATSVEARFADHAYGQNWLSTMAIYAGVCRELEHAEGARVLYEVLDPWRDRSGSSPVSITAFAIQVLAELAIVAGDLDRAEHDLAQAIALEERIGARVARTRTRLASARFYLARADEGDVALARDELLIARSESAAMGMAGVERRATELLDALDRASES